MGHSLLRHRKCLEQNPAGRNWCAGSNNRPSGSHCTTCNAQRPETCSRHRRDYATVLPLANTRFVKAERNINQFKNGCATTASKMKATLFCFFSFRWVAFCFFPLFYFDSSPAKRDLTAARECPVAESARNRCLERA